MKKFTLKEGVLKKTQKICLSVLAGVMAATTLFSGCRLGGMDPEIPESHLNSKNMIFSSEMKAASEKLDGIVEGHGGHDITLDLANDDEYNLLLQRLAWGNKSRANSPQLHRSIEELRAKHLARQENQSRATQDEEEEREVPEGNGHLITRLILDEIGLATAEAHGSVFDGFNYIYLDVLITNAEWEPVSDLKFTECYGECYNEAYPNNYAAPTLETTGQILPDARSPWDPGYNPALRADTLMIYEDNAGNFHVEYAVRLHNWTRSADQLYMPLETVITAPTYNAEEPPAPGLVRVCINRANKRDCDYSLSIGSIPRGYMLLPFAGHIEFPYMIDYDEFSINGETVYKPKLPDADEPNSVREFSAALSYGTTGAIEIFTGADPMNDFFWSHPNTRVRPESNFKVLEWNITGEYNESWASGYVGKDYLNFGKKILGITNPSRGNLFFEIKVSLVGQRREIFPSSAFIIPADYSEDYGENYNPEYAYFDAYIHESTFDVPSGESRKITLEAVGRGEDRMQGTSGWHDSNPVVYSWTIDKAPPEAEIYNAPPPETMVTIPRIRIGGEGVVAYIYKTDVEVKFPGMTTILMTGDWSDQYDLYLPEQQILDTEIQLSNPGVEWAAYTLYVRGIDRAGNQQLVPTECTWTVYPSGDTDGDGNPDLVDLSLSPASGLEDFFPQFHSTQDYAIMKVNTTGYNDMFRYTINNGVANEASSNIFLTLDSLSEGAVTLKLWGKRTPGDAYDLDNPTTYTWLTDFTPPALTDEEVHVCIATDNLTPEEVIQLEITGEDIWTYDYSLDGNAFVTNRRANPLPNTGAAYTSHLIRESMAGDGGPHTIEIRARDKAGQESGLYTFNWEFDDSTQYVKLQDLPPAVTNSTTLHARVGGIITHYSYKYAVYSLNDIELFSYDWTPAIPVGTPMMMPILQFVNSCLAEDSLILMADGYEKPIRDIMIGDYVLAGSLENGVFRERVLPVLDVTTGTEENMYRITDTSGRTLLLTYGHPVILEDNTIKPAQDLVVGDIMHTLTGPRKLVNVTTEPYNSSIYNLTLGSREEYLAKRGKSGNLMYANGYLVGDNTLQITEMKNAVTPSGDPLQNLPEYWHEDYNNSLINN